MRADISAPTLCHGRFWACRNPSHNVPPLLFRIQVCHVDDRDHKVYRCKEQCVKFCKNNHQCGTDCFMECPPCPVKMLKVLPCHHELRVECHVEASRVRCFVPVEKQKPCGHLETLACYKDPATITCKVKVTKTLRCGHEKKDVECHVDADSITCKVIVLKVLEPCGHSQEAECRFQPDMIKCDTEVEKQFKDCGHKVGFRLGFRYSRLSLHRTLDYGKKLKCSI